MLNVRAFLLFRSSDVRKVFSVNSDNPAASRGGYQNFQVF